MKSIKKIILSLVLEGAILVSSVSVQAATAETQNTLSTESEIVALTVDPAVEIQQNSRSGVVNIARTSSGPFTTRSTPELVILESDATSLSLVAYCDGDETDEVIFSIWGNGDDNKSFALDIPFDADGVTNTFTLYIPKGEYKANFHSSTQTVKRGTAVCSIEA